MKYWMRADKSDIIGNEGKKFYANEDTRIISSSDRCSSYSGKKKYKIWDNLLKRILYFHLTVKMYNREDNAEDPWLSLR